MAIPLLEMKLSGRPVAIIKSGDRQLKFVKIKKFQSKYFYVKDIGVFELDDKYEYRYGKCPVYFYNFSNSKPLLLSAMDEIVDFLDKNGTAHLLNTDLLVDQIPPDVDMSKIELPEDPKKEMKETTRQFLDDFSFEDEKSKTNLMLQVHDAKKSPTPAISSDMLGMGMNRGAHAIVQIGKGTIDIVPMFMHNSRAYTKYGVFSLSKESIYGYKKQPMAVFIASDDEDEYAIPLPKKSYSTMTGMVKNKKWNLLESFTSPFPKNNTKNNNKSSPPAKKNISLSSEKPLVQYNADSPQVYHTILKTLYSSRKVVMENLSGNMKKVIPIALIFGGVMALMIVMSNLPTVIDTVAKYVGADKRIVYLTPDEAREQGLNPTEIPIAPTEEVPEDPPDDEPTMLVDNQPVNTVEDVTPPVITVPETIELDSDTRNGLYVKYAVSAMDDVDGSVPVACEPKFNTFFEVGTTTVYCVASDNSGNTSDASFDVIITQNLDRLNTPPVPIPQLPQMVP
jgi:hypothetical protein